MVTNRLVGKMSKDSILEKITVIAQKEDLNEGTATKKTIAPPGRRDFEIFIFTMQFSYSMATIYVKIGH